jgi:two-component system response regulator YesN
MAYKVFLVEDEIVTREGIRDNVDWKSAGFEFCGEAPDGEIALSLIEASKPDVLITDIKMPFMDGLQLSKIIREHMPWVKVVILSGHDEFEYAQSAVKLGVTEYLLKPVSAQDLHQVLEGLSATLDREEQERENLKRLQDKFKDTLLLSREKFLLQLVMGGVSSVEAIEQSQQLGLDIVAKYYLVLLLRIELCDNSQPFDYHEYQKVEQIVSTLAGNNQDVFLTKKDMEELVLLIKGESAEQLLEEGTFLAGLARQEVGNKTTCVLTVEMGTPQNRIGDIHHSFAEALVKVKNQVREARPTNRESGIDQSDLLNMDHIAIKNYIKFGAISDFDDFFAICIQPIARTALKSNLIKHFLFVDIILTVAQFMSDLGGEFDQNILKIHDIEISLSDIKTIEEIEKEMRRIFLDALTFRNSQANHERIIIIHQAKAYIDSHLSDPDLQMNKVATHFNISPSHFSTVFRQEIGETFRDYIGTTRINRAKELLRTTNLKCSEVAYQSGYNDPHYFIFFLKKKTDLTPQQFRAQSQDDKK